MEIGRSVGFFSARTGAILALFLSLAIVSGPARAQTGADLSVEITVDDPTPRETENVNLFITLRNQGPENATTLLLGAPLPGGLEYVSHSANAGSYAPLTGDWGLLTLGGGETATLAIRARAALGTAGMQLVNTVDVVQADQTDPLPGDESDSVLIVVERGPMKMASGSYVGNGSIRTISGLDFAPDFVLVRGVQTEFGAVATSTMGTGLSKLIGDANTLVADAVTAISADGFTAGPAPEVNADGILFHWVAFAAGEEVAIGSYVGDGSNGRLIGNLGMQPHYVMVFPGPSEQSTQRFASQPPGESLEFKSGGVATKRILAFESTGFRIGNDNSVNKDAETFHYIAWDGALGNVRIGSYLGDGVPSRAIDSVVFQPESLLLRTEGGESADLLRSDTMSGALCLPLDDKDPVLTGITALTPAGFAISDDDGANRSGRTFHYAAFRRGIDQVDIAVTTDADRTDPDEGQAVRLTVVIENLASQDATNIEIDAQLPGGLNFVGATPFTGSFVEATGIWSLGTFPAGGSATLQIDAVVAAGTSGALLTHVATLASVDQFDLDPGNDRDSVDLRVRSSDLAVRLSVSDPSPNEGDILQLSVDLTNLGPDATDQTSIRMTLPAGLSFLSSSASQGSYDDVFKLWTVGPVAQIGVATLDLDVQVDTGTAGGVLSTKANLDSSLPVDPNGANDDDSVDVTVQAADLHLKVTVDDPTPNELDTIRLTISLDNEGPHDATGVLLTDLLPVGLSYVSSTPSIGGYAPGSGLWTVGAVPAFSTASLWIDAVVDIGTAGSTLTNSASVASIDQTDPDATDDSASVAIGVAGADVALAMSADDVAPGELQLVRISLLATNRGPNTASGLKLSDLLPVGLSYSSHFASQGSYTLGTGEWVVGGLANGATATLDLDVTVDAGTGGTILTNLATVITLNQADPDDTNDTASVDLAVGGADVGLAIVIDDPVPNVGDTIRATLTAQNNGPIGATNLLIRADVPAGLNYASDSTTAGSYAPGTGLWTIASFADAALDTLDLYLTVAAGSIGATIAIDASIEAADQADPVAVNNSASLVLRVQSADLSVAIGVDDPTPNPGQALQFTVTLTNAGPDTATNLAASVAFPAGVSFVAATPEQGSYDQFTGTWTLVSVSKGTNVALVLDATQQTGFAGTTLTVPVSIAAVDQGDPAVSNNADSVNLTVQSSDIAVSIDPDDPTPVESQVVRYSIRVDNLGPHAATGLTIEAPLPGALDYAFHNASVGAYDPSLGIWNIGTAIAGSFETLELDARVMIGTADSRIDMTVSVGSLSTGDLAVANNTATARIDVATTFGVAVTASQFPAVLRKGGGGVEVLRIVLANDGSSDETLQAMLVHDATFGLGSTSDFDASWSELVLFDAISGSELARTDMSAGIALFSGFSRELGRSERMELAVEAGASLQARDGDLLDLLLEGASDLSFVSGESAVGAWPLNPAGRFAADGMVAQRVLVDPLPAPGILAGSTRNLVLSFVVPSNGYASDVLEKINLVNLGSAQNGSDIVKLEAWQDNGDGNFSPSLDSQLGQFLFTGDRWELTGLNASVAVTGCRVFVTVDLNENASVGRGVRLSIPGPPDGGLGMQSENDGPIDDSVEAETTHVVSASDRILLSSKAIAPAVARPGQTNRVLLHLQASNTYTVEQVLSSLRLENSTTGFGAQADFDAEIASLTLREDGNNDGLLDDLSVDPLLASGAFIGGRASFTGLAWTLPAGATRDLFVLAKISGSLAADGDILSARVSSASDVSFEIPVTIGASWPLYSGAAWRIDGMLRSQIGLQATPVATIGPGEGPALALDLSIPQNGYAADLLESLRLINMGTAGTGDIVELRLWRDGGNGQFDSGSGDDADLGPMSFVASSWQSPLLSQPLGFPPTRIFVAATVAASPSNASTIRLAVPINGITVVSGNDGPIDTALENDATVLISSAPLLATLQVSPSVSTIGSMVTASMVVRNLGTELIGGITPDSFVASGTGAMTPSSGPAPVSFDLAVAAADTFRWQFTASASGDVRLRAAASGVGNPSGIGRISLQSSSNSHRIFAQADSMALFAVEAEAFTVNRGQTGVVPLTLTFEHRSGVESADILVQSLRVRLANAVGGGIVPDQLLARVLVSEGGLVYIDKSVLESVGDVIDLPFTAPARISPDEPTSISIRLDILPTTTQPNFRVVIDAATAIVATDENSGAPVAIQLVGDSYPLRSGLASILEEATELRLDVTDTTPLRLGPGIMDAGVMSLLLENPGIDGLTADVRLQSFAITLESDAGSPVATPSAVLASLSVRSSLQLHLERTLSAADDDTLILFELSPPVSVPVNSGFDLFVDADLQPSAALGSYRLRLLDPSFVSAIDANTRRALAVSYLTTPLVGNSFEIEAVADEAEVYSEALLPPSVSVGMSTVAALRATITHTGSVEAGRLRCDQLTVRVSDQARQGLVPATYLSRVRAFWEGSEILELTNLPAAGDRFSLALGAQLLEPGTSAQLELRIDIEGTAPAGFLELSFDGSDLQCLDANTMASVAIRAAAGASLPGSSGLTRVSAPANQLLAELLDEMPVMVAPAANAVLAGRVILENPADEDAGAINVDLIRFAGRRDSGTIESLGRSARRLSAWLDGVLLARSDSLAADSTGASLPLSPPLVIAAGESLELELRMDLQQLPSARQFQLGLLAAGVSVVQPSGVAFTIRVAPRSSSFPFWTEATSFAPTDLAESFSNYPNPFAAGRESTDIAYFLRGDARVTLRIYSMRGERVVTVVDGERRLAGMQQNDLWDGRNGTGDVVRNGVYLAQLSVEYGDGQSKEIYRKIAVVR